MYGTEEYGNSLWRSRGRREKARKHRVAVRLLSIPAVMGLIPMIYFVSRPFPVEEPWWGLLGVLMIVPFLVKLTERS